MGAFTRQYIGSYWGRQANLSSRFSTNCIHASACVLKGRGGFGPVVNIFRSFCAVHILTVNILDYFSQCQNILFWFKIFFLWLCCAQQFNVNVDNIVYVDWLIGCVFIGTQVSTYCALPRCCLCWLIDYMWLAGRYTAMLFMLTNWLDLARRSVHVHCHMLVMLIDWLDVTRRLVHMNCHNVDWLIGWGSQVGTRRCYLCWLIDWMWHTGWYMCIATYCFC